MEQLTKPETLLSPNSHRPLVSRITHRSQPKGKSPNPGMDFHSKEDLYKSVLSLKIHINDLTEENKKLKTKIAGLEFATSQTSFKVSQKPFRVLSPEVNQKLLFAAYSDLTVENKYLKHEILSQKKLINELLKYAPPEYLKIVETHRKQSKVLGTIRKNIDLLTRFSPSPSRHSASQRNLALKYFVPAELEMISEISNQILENAKENKLEIEEIWYVMNPNGLEEISLKEFVNGARALNLRVSDGQLEVYFKFFSQKGKLLKSDLVQALKPY